MNRVTKELYKQLDEVLKEVASQINIEDVCINALQLMKEAYLGKFIPLKISLKHLIFSNKKTLEEKIETLNSINEDLEIIKKSDMKAIHEIRKILDKIEKKDLREINDLKFVIAKSIEGMTKKLEKNKSGDKQDE